jgi:hypothetical protein
LGYILGDILKNSSGHPAHTVIVLAPGKNVALKTCMPAFRFRQAEVHAVVELGDAESRVADDVLVDERLHCDLKKFVILGLLGLRIG